MKKRRNKTKIKDLMTIKVSYDTKYQEYDKMSLEELKILYNSDKKPGGTYRKAFLDVTNKKLLEIETNKDITTEIKPEIKEN